jgi:hypothetical protein
MAFPSFATRRISSGGIPAERWHEHDEFRARVLNEFEKIPDYLTKGFLQGMKGCAAYPRLAGTKPVPDAL